MIDTVAILVTSILVLFIAVRATTLDSRERSGSGPERLGAPGEED